MKSNKNHLSIGQSPESGGPKKRTYRELNSDYWIQSPMCQPLHHTSSLTSQRPLLFCVDLCIFTTLVGIRIINAEMSDSQYYQGAAIVVLVINAISFVGLLFVLTIYLIRWKQINSFPMRISFYLCLSALIQNLYVIIYPPMSVNSDMNSQTATPYCIFESMLKTAFDLSSIIWTLIIMYCTFATVVYGFTLERLELFFLAVGYLLPILLALIPIFLGYYGYDVYYCWFDCPDPTIQFGLKMGYYFGPLWVFFVLQIIWAVKTYKKLKEVGLEGRELNIFKKILLFPIILLITGLFATIDLIYIFVNINDFLEWLDILSMVLLSTYGIFVSLAYGFNPLIRDQILILLKIKPVQVVRNSNSSQTSRQTQKIAELINM